MMHFVLPADELVVSDGLLYVRELRVGKRLLTKDGYKVITKIGSVDTQKGRKLKFRGYIFTLPYGVQTTMDNLVDCELPNENWISYEIGRIVGDGYTRKYDIGVAGLEEERHLLNKIMERLLKEYKVDKVVKNYALGNAAIVRINSKEIVEKMRSDMPELKLKSKSKVVPYLIRSRYNVFEFLAGIFDADGAVDLQNGKPCRAYLGTSSPEMARQVFAIMSLCGCTPYIRHVDVGKYGTAYRVIVTGSDMEKFARSVNLRHKEKRRRILSFRSSTDRGKNMEVIDLGEATVDAISLYVEDNSGVFMFPRVYISAEGG